MYQHIFSLHRKKVSRKFWLLTETDLYRAGIQPVSLQVNTIAVFLPEQILNPTLEKY